MGQIRVADWVSFPLPMTQLPHRGAPGNHVITSKIPTARDRSQLFEVTVNLLVEVRDRAGATPARPIVLLP